MNHKHMHIHTQLQNHVQYALLTWVIAVLAIINISINLNVKYILHHKIKFYKLSIASQHKMW